MRIYLAILTVSILLYACSGTTPYAVVPQEAILTETGTNIKMLYTEDGLPTIKIEAPKTIHYNTNEPYMEFPDGMQLYVYNDTGKVESTLTSKYGTMADGSGQMQAKDSVVVINANGEVLNAESLTWEQEQKVIHCDGYVEIRTKDEIIYGTGFHSNENFTEYQIFNISGIVNVKEGAL